MATVELIGRVTYARGSRSWIAGTAPGAPETSAAADLRLIEAPWATLSSTGVIIRRAMTRVTQGHRGSPECDRIEDGIHPDVRRPLHTDCVGTLKKARDFACARQSPLRFSHWH